VDTNVPLECGCPPPVPVMRAGDARAAEAELPANARLTSGDASSETAANTIVPKKTEAPQTLSSGPETQPLPPSEVGETHVQVDAPFVFRARKHTAAPPPPTDEVAALPVMERSARPAQLEIQIQPPSAPAASTQAKAEHHGLLRRIGRFFADIFR